MEVSILKIVGVSVFLFLMGSCASTTRSLLESGHSDSRSSLVSEFEKPRGDELRIASRQESTRRYRVRVTNISEGDLFIPYEPGQGTLVAEYFPFGMEWREVGSKDFRFLNTWGHFAPRLNRLAPAESFEFFFEPKESGEYRLLFNYSIDPRLVSELAAINPAEKEPVEHEKFRKAYYEMKTPVIKVIE